MASKRRRQWGEASFLGEDESKQQSSIREFFSKKPRAPAARPALSRSSYTPKKPTPAAVAGTTVHISSHISNSAENRATAVTPSSVAKQPPQQEPQTHSNAKSSSNQAKPKLRKLQQMYLDLGQRNFGKQTVCNICGMLFVHGVEEDAKEHERICKEVREGVAFQLQRTACRVVAEFGSSSSGSHPRHHNCITSAAGGGTKRASSPKDTEGGYIIEVRPTDSYALRQKVAAVMAIVDKELGFVDHSSNSHTTSTVDDGKHKPKKQPSTTKGRPAPTVFLYIRQKRIVGLVSAEITRQAYRLLLVNNNNNNNNSSSSNEGKQEPQRRHHHPQHERSTQAYRAMIGIHKLWVHSRVRNQSLATRLMDAVRARMVFGTVVPSDLVAFSSPTEAGTRFAQTYVHTESGSKETPVLVYDLPM